MSEEPSEEVKTDQTSEVAVEQLEEGELETSLEKLASKAKRLSLDRVRTIIESLLFVADKPLSVEIIRSHTGVELTILQEQLEFLQGHYRDGICGIVLHQVGGGWQFRTCPSTAEYVQRLLRVKPQRLTRAALESLAIIAYRQPVTRPEIEDIRGVDSGAVIRALLDRKLIKIVGKKEEIGRPLLYGTTPEFLEFFNLGDLSSLPTLREFQELSTESQKIVEKETGEAAPPSSEGLVEALRDNKLEEKLKETHAEADAALEDLETAMAESEDKVKQTAKVLNPQTDQPAEKGS